MMTYCRTNLGARCVLENNAIRTPVQANYEAMYDRIKAMGPPMSFQTANPNKIGDLLATLTWAAQFGANSVELPSSYTQQPPSTYVKASEALINNPT
jgi:hypothetical protein